MADMAALLRILQIPGGAQNTDGANLDHFPEQVQQEAFGTGAAPVSGPGEEAVRFTFTVVFEGFWMCFSQARSPSSAPISTAVMGLLGNGP